MVEVTVEKPGEMNLLGLILEAVLEKNLDKADNRRRAERLAGSVGVRAGRMTVTLRCQKGQLTIASGLDDGCRARVSGPMEAFLDVALGKGLVGHVVSGRVRMGGNPLFLLKLLPLLRV